MKTKLTDKQLELMTKVHDRMYADFASDKYLERVYICHNIVQVENGLDQFDERHDFSTLADKEGSLSKDLLQMINNGIENCVSFDLYLEECGADLKWTKIVTSFAQLGRLAWLDRIVETGEIE